MTLWEIMVGYPGSQDIDQHPYYPYRLAKLAWHVYHHSFTKNGRWFLGGTAIANLSFTMFWSFDIQTWILATAINCLWLPDFIAKSLPLNDTVTLIDQVIIHTGQEVTLTATTTTLSPNSLVHFERLPLALVSTHDEGFAADESSVIPMRLIGRFRGKWSLSAIRISRPGPFGLIARSRVVASSVQITVLPSAPTANVYVIAHAICLQMKAAQSTANKAGDPGTDVIRTHSPGDPSNRIDWRASSRSAATSRPALQVRVAQQSAVDGVHIVIDERVLTEAISRWQHWSGRGVREPLPIEDFEALIRLAYACALTALKDGTAVASISSQRQRYTQLRNSDDIAEAFANIAHFETPADLVGNVPEPVIPDADAYVFSLIPQTLTGSYASKQRQSVCIVSDLHGAVTEVVTSA
jgi:uncharacterized protein (DUF58 family)